MRNKWDAAWRSLWLVSSVVLVLALLSCGGHGGTEAQATLHPGAKPDTAADTTDLRQALAELDALSVPAGADAAQFAVLKAKLREMLHSKVDGKLTSAAPISARSKVGYFSIAGSGGTANLNWTYRNEGDFNLDGTVAVTDLTPLGIFYGRTSSSGDWSTARAADGSMDGNVNIADLTCIGVNFTRRVEGYYLQYSAAYSGGSWTTVCTLPLADFSSVLAGNGYRTCAANITSGMTTGFYRLTPYDGAHEGIPSDVVAYPATNYYESEPNDDGAGANALPAFPFPTPLVDGNLGTGNHYGDVDGDDVDIFYRTAPDNGTLDIWLSLDSALGDLDLYLFQQGVTDAIGQSQGRGDTEHVSIAVTSGVNYYVMVRRFSGFGEYMLRGAFTPQGANTPPVAALSATPSSGAAPLSVVLNAGASIDTGGSIVKYEYDFGEGGGFQDYGTDNSVIHNYLSAGSFTATVRVTDNGGLTDTASTGVSVTGGGAPGTVSGTILTAGVSHGLPGVTVSINGGSLNTSVQTNASGYYEFTSVPAGSYNVTPLLNQDTFAPSSRSVNVSGAAVTGQDFTAAFVSSLVPYPFTSSGTIAHPALGTTIDIYIENGSSITGWYQGLEDAFRASAPRWNQVGDPWGLFHIQFTNNLAEAEIWVHYVQSLGESTLGRASWSGTNYQINLPMEIQMATYCNGSVVTTEVERMGAIHEVGHTLGLWDHSNATSDIMYPIATQEWPSARDEWTIYTLYHTTAEWTTGGRGGSYSGDPVYMEYSID